MRLKILNSIKVYFSDSEIVTYRDNFYRLEKLYSLMQ